MEAQQRKETPISIEHENNYEATYNNRVYKAREEVIEALRTGK